MSLSWTCVAVFRVVASDLGSFSTPIRYQTDLMVMGPDGYRPREFLCVGLPLALVVTITALDLLPVIRPL